MKKIEKFVCEICKTEYVEEVKAQTCEDTHSKVHIVKTHFKSNQKFPDNVIIEFDDDNATQLRYKFNGFATDEEETV